ncbi:unnamed protein product [Onchocerca flexuosa]|uniref:Uncharacterized protein n=1 Tax=Onchocerca flexuosa TaxID=387005 RepID=A0A183HQK6_9BILA|nr:unnamed protein product [Onchocerca flexuosa]
MLPYGFPPIESSTDLPICLYETNGRLIYGAEEELHEMEANALVCYILNFRINYPF